MVHPPTDLRTDTLSLRPARWRDAVFISRLLGDGAVMRYLGGPVPWHHRPRRIAAYLRTGPREALWIVQAPHPFGLIHITESRDPGVFELSYQFIPSSWGQGRATKAAAAAIADAHDRLGHQRLIAETQAANHASIRLLHRLGFAEHRRVNRFSSEQIVFTRTLP